MEKESFKYTIDELLLNDYFISSILHPTLESQEFWKDQIEAGTVSADDFEKAALFTKAVQSRKNKLFRKEKELLWEKIEIGNKATLKNRIRTLYIMCISAAACVLLLLGVSGYLYNGSKQDILFDPIAQLKNATIAPGSDIRLMLSESDQVTFEENNTEVKYSDKGEVKVNSRTVVKEKASNRIAAKKEKSGKEETAVQYNQLIVPKGKHATLLLSDGTKLWVNAGSRVIFPITFAESKREIYVDGEIYLEVTRNESSPFIVKTDRMLVNVLGTSFNIKSYGYEDTDDVVLVTGLVHVKTTKGKEIGLSPNQRFSCTNDGATSVDIVDVYDHICWKDGLLRYKSESLSTILERLSAYYGKEIQWDSDVAKLKCSGKLDLKEDMEKVLSGLTRMIPVKYAKQDGCYYFSINPNN